MINNQSNAVATIIADAHNDSASRDFETARANILTTIDVSTKAINALANLADQSQNPRAYEVLAKLIDSIVQANRELLELQTTIREIEAADEPINNQAKTVNNNLFISATTEEIQRMVEGMKNAKKP